MTQTSFLWEGTTTGDATLAPYTRLRFNRWFGGPYSNSDATKIHVIPGYLDNLFVQALSGTLNILTVKAGAALVGDYLYINDEPVYVTIPSNTVASMRRCDSIVLRIDNTTGAATNRSVRIAYLKGYETAYTFPITPPVLLQDEDGIWEVELARVTVESTTFVLEQKHIASQVGYINLFDQFSATKNIVMSSECLQPAYSHPPQIVFGGWYTEAATATSTAGIGTATRSRSITITNAIVADFVRQYVPYKRKDLPNKYPFIIDGFVQPQQSNGVITVRVSALSSVSNDPATTWSDGMYQVELTHEVNVYGEPTVTTKRVLEVFEFDESLADNPLIAFRIDILNAGIATDDYIVGPFQLSRGFFSGGQRPIHAFEFYHQRLTDASWDGDAKSSATTTINLNASYGAAVPAYLKGIVVLVRCRDSGSAASANCGLDVYSYDGVTATKQGGVDLSGEVNDAYRSGQIIVPINDYWKNGSIANRRLQFVVRATGAATLDADIRVIGMLS